MKNITVKLIAQIVQMLCPAERVREGVRVKQSFAAPDTQYL